MFFMPIFVPVWVVPPKVLFSGVELALMWWTASLAALPVHRRQHLTLAAHNPRAISSGKRPELKLVHSRDW